MTEYYNSNEMRAYPVYENATQHAADGTALPMDMLVDMMVTVPGPLASTLYVSAVTVTPAIVSLAVASSTAGGIFAITLMQPVIPCVPYALTPIAGLASGCVVFGPAVSRAPLNFISGGISQSGLDMRAVHPIRPRIVLSLGRHGSPSSRDLRGVVNLAVGNNMTIRYDPVAGMLKLGLVESAAASFVNPCDQEAAYGNCGGTPPIRTINGVGPNADGVITLKVDNG